MTGSISPAVKVLWKTADSLIFRPNSWTKRSRGRAASRTQRGLVGCSTKGELHVHVVAEKGEDLDNPFLPDVVQRDADGYFFIHAVECCGAENITEVARTIQEARCALVKCLGLAYDPGCTIADLLHEWHDHPLRTRRQVIDALNKAAKSLLAARPLSQAA